MGKQRTFHRSDRVGKHILESLSGLIMTELRDPRAASAQITEVKVTGDISIATVYYVSLESEEFDPELQAVLAKASRFLRGKLSQAINLRHVPILKFKYDESLSTGRRMERLLSTLDIPEEE